MPPFITDEKRSYTPHFFVGIVVLCVATLYTAINEIGTRRPWKEHQREFFQSESVRLQGELDKLGDAFADGGSEAKKLDELLGRIAELEQSVAQQASQGETSAVEEEIDALKLELNAAERERQFARSEWEAAYYRFRHALQLGHDTESAGRAMSEIQARIDTAGVRADGLAAQLAASEKKRPEERARLSQAREQLATLERPLQTAERRLSAVAGRWPEVRQIVVPRFERNEFGQVVSRVDRCTSCHVGADNPLAASDSGLFARHPRRVETLAGERGESDVLLGIHSPEKFGCTSCHQGQGIAMTAEGAHGWKELGVKRIKYWDYPMLLRNRIDATCNQCHREIEAIPGGHDLNRGRELFRYLGCFGCHQVEGYENFVKIGPELRRVTSKDRSGWLVNWIQNPRTVHERTRMPTFTFSRTQATQIAAYLIDSSEPYQTSNSKALARGNAARGKETVDRVGCAGCHKTDDREREERRLRFDFAPEITTVSTKVRSADWVYDWIKNPTHYSPTTRMPNLRLSDAEAADITAYLTGGNQQPEAETSGLDAELNSETNIQEGELLIRTYGCFGCHEINGFEKAERIAPPLNGIGAKEPYELDFGNTLNSNYTGPTVEETWQSWITNKLKNPRVFATDRANLRMPSFILNDDEVESLLVFLMSLRTTRITEHYVAVPNDIERRTDRGLLLAEHFNCRGCHTIAGVEGDIVARYDNRALAPPSLEGEGKKVRSDWLFNFIKSPSVLRPWLKVRMPSFTTTDAQASALVEYLYVLSGERFLHDFAQPDQMLPAERAIGTEIFAKLKCLNCHNLSAGGGRQAADLAPDLSMARERLRYGWILDWLKDPQALQPETRMPSFFPLEDDDDPTSFSTPLWDIMDGDAIKQMETLTATLYELKQKN